MEEDRKAGAAYGPETAEGHAAQARRVAGATTVSRIFGFLRDITVAALLGTGPAADAFIAAFRLPNGIRRLFAEGTFAMAVVPVVCENRRVDGQSENLRFVRSGLVWAVILAGGAVLGGWALAPVFMRLLAPGFTAHPETLMLSVVLQRWLMPYVGCVLVTAYGMGVLNAWGHFSIPAWSPAVLNLCILSAACLLIPLGIPPDWALVSGVCAGGGVQLVLHGLALKRCGFVFTGPVRMGHPGLGRMGRRILPTVWGASVFQVNVLVGTCLASLLSPGAVASLYYADRLVQFPLGIVAMSVSIAALPAWSAAEAPSAFARTVAADLNGLGAVLLPATVGLVLLCHPIAELCFKRGAFDAKSVQETAVAVAGYAVGLWAYGAARLLVAVLAATGGVALTVRAASVSILANGVVGLLLLPYLGHFGIALSTSIAAFINLYLLASALDYRQIQIAWRYLAGRQMVALGCSCMMGLVVFAMNRYSMHIFMSGMAWRAASLMLTILTGVLVYGALARCLLRDAYDRVLHHK